VYIYFVDNGGENIARAGRAGRERRKHRGSKSIKS